ncbi:MAG: hypothetical protein R3Y56_00295 [Akkermansia sp.]
MTHIKTTAGKLYSALCANACTIKSEEGIIIKELEANKQDYFVAPEAYIQTDDAGLLLTECFNEAPIGLVAIGGINEQLDNLSSDVGSTQTQLDALEATVNQLTTETIPSIESSLEDLGSNHQALSEEVSALDEALNTLSGRIDSLSSQLTTNIQTLTNSISNLSVYPDWSRAVLLSPSTDGSVNGETKSLQYTAPSNGWIVGWGYKHDGGQAIFRVNNVVVANDYGDIATIQVLIANGDSFSISEWTLGELHFVPCR